MFRRLASASLCLLLVLPSTLASGTSATDPAGDQAAPLQHLCHDDATDLVEVRLSSDGTNLALEATVVDPAGSPACAVVVPLTVEHRVVGYHLVPTDPAHPVRWLDVGASSGASGIQTCVWVVPRNVAPVGECAPGGSMYVLNLPLTGTVMESSRSFSYDLRGVPLATQARTMSWTVFPGDLLSAGGGNVDVQIVDEAHAPAFTT